MGSSTTHLEWHRFLTSPAITFTHHHHHHHPSSSDTNNHDDRYWNSEALREWQAIHPTNENRIGSGVVSYGSLLLLASSACHLLHRRMVLLSPAAAVVDGTKRQSHVDYDGEEKSAAASSNSRTKNDQVRIGLAVPEGPFLPLFVLAVHALNVMASTVEDGCSFWKKDDGRNSCSCNSSSVVLIPMDAEDAPDRLRHILTDSAPHMILVAPGRDTDAFIDILADHNDDDSLLSCSMELVDYTALVRDALGLITKGRGLCDNDDGCYRLLLERLYTRHVRDVMMDSVRYGDLAIPNKWDVARLVAWGCGRLNYCLDIVDELAVNDTPEVECHTLTMNENEYHHSGDDKVVSHIVYTSGTTGKPKGCVSSLRSLQHYIRAKNRAHGIETKGPSTVLLASAVTFDPCFSDVLATFVANSTLAVASRHQLHGHSTIHDEDDNEHDNKDIDSSNIVRYRGLTELLRQMQVTHVLCTPTLWATVEGDPPNNIPSLQVVALGGEPIPKSMRNRWARKCLRQQLSDENDDDDNNDERTDTAYDRMFPRLLATYGVTEACVYQTCGEVFATNSSEVACRESVGQPLVGSIVHICRPLSNDESTDIESSITNTSPIIVDDENDDAGPTVGEVVLSGAQVDGVSSYLNLPELTRRAFVTISMNGPKNNIDANNIAPLLTYRTGDLGYIDSTTKNLHILGRIKGDGMVKVNGVRIELAEIESALIDDTVDDRKGGGLVADCLATTTASHSNDDSTQKQIVAYCIVSPICLAELCIDPEQLTKGFIIRHGPLLSVLRARCNKKVRKGCTPSFFVLLDRLPLSPTGKRSRSGLPPLQNCSSTGDKENEAHESLWEYGRSGPIVADKVCECLNLQSSCQRDLMTRGINFFALGGDSLSATRVCRGLYALHHGVANSRNLGGETGTLDGLFAVKHLLASPTLGDYVKFLNQHSAFDSQDTCSGLSSKVPLASNDNILYNYLIEAISLGLTCIASSLLDFGVDPNPSTIDGKIRLGKIKDRNEQRELFRANPLHLACVRGDIFLVKKLVAAGCKANTPDAQGSFPIHLACSRMKEGVGMYISSAIEEDLNRLECVKVLLDTTPISIKDSNKQTILHSAARSGHCQLLKFIMKQWRAASETTGMKFKSHNNEPGKIFDWYDRWFRTPVHWAVLNQRLEALQILIEGGCSAFPSKPKAGVSKRSTSVIIESPLEMCLRLYGDSEGVGKRISSILINAAY